jgi:hypothetical protein
MRPRPLLSLLILGYPALATAQTYLPDRHHTPGALNPEVTQEKLHGTVCSRGYTKTIRPPKQYTSRLKKKQLHELGLSGRMRDYEEDHLVPLCAGGAPHDARNLWPQPRNGEWGAAAKDQLEESVCRQLCRGDISLKDAQAIFLEPDWTVAYRRYFRK